MKVIIALAIIGMSISPCVGDDSATRTQPPKQSTNPPALSGQLDGVVVNVNVDKKLVKVVIWNSSAGELTRNNMGWYQARTLKWSGDTVIKDDGEKTISAIEAGNGFSDIKSVTDLLGWKTEITFDDGLISKISLLAMLQGESMAGYIGNSGFVFAQQPIGKISTERTEELDRYSGPIDTTNAPLAAGGTNALDLISSGMNRTANAPVVTDGNTAQVAKTRSLPFHGPIVSLDASTGGVTVGELSLNITSSTKISINGVPATLTDFKIGDKVIGAYKIAADGTLNVTILRLAHGMKITATTTP